MFKFIIKTKSHTSVFDDKDPHRARSVLVNVACMILTLHMHLRALRTLHLQLLFLI